MNENHNSFLAEVKDTQAAAQLLMQQPHYQKLGQAGIFAIIETAKALGVDPKIALTGGLYFVKGKVEMSARMMAGLIRARQHSITRSAKSDDTICILHGKRADNGDTWVESFSMDEAKRAGLTGNMVWKNFPRDMLYARALSRLARQLFPDVIGNCYVEGEISLDANIRPVESEEMSGPDLINEEQLKILQNAIEEAGELGIKTANFLSNAGLDDMTTIPVTLFEKIMKRLEVKNETTD